MIHRLSNLFARLHRDRRGAVAVTFGITAIVFLGLAGAATEAGTWYFAHRKGQNAADAAATAGAVMVAFGRSDAIVQSSGTDIASRNGYTNGSDGVTVTINKPPSTGAYSGNNYAVEAIVTKTQTVAFGRLFNISALTVTNRAVALMISNGQPCILSLNNNLTMTGNDTVAASDCILASNSTDSTSSIGIGGSADITAYSLRSVGGCSGCSSGRAHLTRPYSAFAAPMSNPFAGLDAWTPPTFTSGQCDNIPNKVSGAVTMVPYETSGRAYCQTLHTNGSDYVNFQPGTYFFKNSDLRFDGGQIRCTACFDGSGNAIDGVNIILVGDSGNIGGVDINAQTDMKLSGKSSGTLTAALQGVLIYRVSDACSGGCSVKVNGGSSSWWRGGMYFPDINVTANGNESNSPVDCTMLVAGGITLTGTSTNIFDNSGCSGMGLDYSPNRVALLESDTEMKRLRSLLAGVFRANDGVSSLEFALIAPILAVAMLATYDLGSALQQQIRLNSAVRAGGLFAQSWPDPPAAVASQVQTFITPWADVTVPTPTMACDCWNSADNSATTTACTNNSCTGSLILRRFMTISASRPFTPIFYSSITSTSASYVARIQ